MKHWLFKSEPDDYSIDDLAREPQGEGVWDGIRNHQARNLLRDSIKIGDQVFFYHSSCNLIGVVGCMEVVKSAYPDPAQYIKSNDYYDIKSSPDRPKWFSVNVKLVRKFDSIVTLKQIKTEPLLADMVLLKQGRLSIQPVSANEWSVINRMAGRKS